VNANTVYYRNAPRVEVLRGFWGNENKYNTSAFPVDPSVTSITSGQILYVGPSNTWLLASASTAKGFEPYIAMEDSTDTDVISVGKLLALSFSNVAALQSAFFDLTQVYTRGSVLTYSSTIPGSLTVAPATAGNGFIQNPSVDVLGIVTTGVVDFSVGGPGGTNPLLAGLVANCGINSEALPIVAGGNYAGQTVGSNNALIGKIPMLAYDMRWFPARDVTNTTS
jgi:hypothetical protein